MTENHEHFIREAIQLAEMAAEHGNEPFGALLVCDGEILLTAENTILTENDVTCHAELNLVSKASRSISADIRGRCTLYTSTEPCAMCATAIYWAGISRIVYACPAEELAKIKGSSFLLPSRELFAMGKRMTEVIGPILADEAIKVHHKYWKREA
jgi:tRNA(Arg) A34 adenosine deaminase TadA